MSGPRPARRATGLALAIAMAVAGSSGLTLPATTTVALLGDAETVAATVSTETLDPPTSVDATALLFLTVSITWVATVDSRATGYQVLRSTTSGSGYAVIGTVTPRTATSYTDLPLVPGTYFYVVRSYYGSWTSVNSNQDSVFAV
jgi:hypothetical protein